jgi:serine protease
MLAGVWNDNATAAPTNATQAQIAQEALNAATLFGNITQGPNLNAQYVIASPTGTHPDGFPSTGFCGWHAYTTASFGKLAFTNLPYVPDLGVGACTTISSPNKVDGLLSTETHEYSETVTDFFPSRGWHGGGGEIGDECVALDGRITLSTGTFDVQGEWSNSANKCVTQG